MTNLIDILLYSLIVALATYLHNGLYKYNKTLFVVICSIFIETILYKFIQYEYYFKVHIIFIIIVVWGLMIYSFYLKYLSNEYKKGNKECRRIK